MQSKIDRHDDDTVETLKRALADGFPLAVLAEAYLVSEDYLIAIKDGREHAEVPGYYGKTGPVIMRHPDEIMHDTRRPSPPVDSTKSTH
jgi:hypothetical protein